MAIPESRGRTTTAKRLHLLNARRICASCPVLRQCRAWALTDPDPVDFMVAGGLTVHERDVIRGTSRRQRHPIEHGTHSGYVQHHARHEVSCDACKAAHTRYTHGGAA